MFLSTEGALGRSIEFVLVLEFERDLVPEPLRPLASSSFCFRSLMKLEYQIPIEHVQTQ